MKIHVAVISHRHGQTVSAARTKRKLLNELYAYVKQWWESEIPGEEMPSAMPKQAVIDLYFELVEHECLETLTEVTLAGNDETGRTKMSRTCAAKLSRLFDAMERHGNAEGTETQLGDASEFLRLAIAGMSSSERAGFFNSTEAREFLTREGGR